MLAVVLVLGTALVRGAVLAAGAVEVFVLASPVQPLASRISPPASATPIHRARLPTLAMMPDWILSARSVSVAQK